MNYAEELKCAHVCTLVSSGTFYDMIKTLLDDIEREHSDKKSPYLLFACYLLLERCLPALSIERLQSAGLFATRKLTTMSSGRNDEE